MIQSKRFVITGRVQGVGYRYFVMRAVRGLELTGWVRNLADRSVEVLVDGGSEDLAALAALLEKGPPGGRVDRVRKEPTHPTNETTFRIKY